MSYVAHGMKLVQFFVLAKYCGAAFPHYFKPVNAVLPEAYEVQTYDFELNVMAVVDVLLFAVGQALSSGVYSSLGTVGTFYGVRFGYSVPWVTGFPYNLGISDPQYWGAILTAMHLHEPLEYRRLLRLGFSSVIYLHDVRGTKRKDPCIWKENAKIGNCHG